MSRKEKQARRRARKCRQLLAKQGQEGGPTEVEVEAAKERLAKLTAAQNARQKPPAKKRRVMPTKAAKKSQKIQVAQDDVSEYVPSVSISDRGDTGESAESDYAPSVGDVDSGLEFVPDGPRDGDASTTSTLLTGDLPPEAKALQHRVFGWSGDVSETTPARCIWCHAPYHLGTTCPLRRCKSCGQVDKHWYRACPTHGRCKRCRRRGHREERCSETTMLAPCAEEPCEICDAPDHIERACPFQYRGYMPPLEAARGAAPRIRLSCYACASDKHFGDDCPKLSAKVREQRRSSGSPWNKKWVARCTAQRL